MEGQPNFFPTKKLLIFGSEGAGKTTLTSMLKDNDFKEESPSKEGIKSIYFYIINYFIIYRYNTHKNNKRIRWWKRINDKYL